MRYLSVLSLITTLMLMGACSTASDGTIKVSSVGEDGNPLAITDMPKGYNYADNPADFDKLDFAVSDNSIELYDPNTGARAGAMQDNSMTMPSYSGGINVANSSVTIYPLNQQMQNTFQGQAPVYNNTGTTINQQFGIQPYIPMSSGEGFIGNSDSQIYFRHGSSRLGQGDLGKISSLASNNTGMITVEGHASRPTQVGEQTVEANILNLKESMNRSFAVSSALLKKGVPADNIKTVSYGSAKASGNPEQDRRVDIIAGY